MTRRPSRGDHKRVGQGRASGEVDSDEVFGFVVFEGRPNSGEQRRLELGDVIVNNSGSRCSQGQAPFQMVRPRWRARRSSGCDPNPWRSCDGPLLNHIVRKSDITISGVRARARPWPRQGQREWPWHSQHRAGLRGSSRRAAASRRISARVFDRQMQNGERRAICAPKPCYPVARRPQSEPA